VQRHQQKKDMEAYRDRLSKVKSTLNTGPPASQPHLTLYGRDYASKKRATTEAAFADLKMIQAISRTMTRKHEVPERKGPISLNADARKAEVFRVMKENHRLLDHIEGMKPFAQSADLERDYRAQQRYVIQTSHTARLAGDYDHDISRIKSEDAAKFSMTQRSIALRRQAAERLGKTTGSVSLPSLTAASSREPGTSSQIRQPAKLVKGPKNWTSPGEAAAAEDRIRGQRQQAKVGKPQEPLVASPSRTTEPPAAVSGPRPAVRFAAPAPEGPAEPLVVDAADAEGDEADLASPAQRALRRGGPPLLAPTKAPEAEEPQEDCAEEDALQVEAAPAPLLVEEPGPAEREEAEPGAAALPEPLAEAQGEPVPPPAPPLDDAEPAAQAAVLLEQVPAQAGEAADEEALGRYQKRCQAANRASRSPSPKAGSGRSTPIGSRGPSSPVGFGRGPLLGAASPEQQQRPKPAALTPPAEDSQQKPLEEGDEEARPSSMLARDMERHSTQGPPSAAAQQQSGE